MSKRLRRLAQELKEATSWWGYAVPNLQQVKMKQGGSGFPFGTESAKKVWEKAQKIARQDPDAKESVVLQQAMDAARVPPIDLTPEDLRILDLAIHWALSGKSTETPPKSNARIGGTPGGPFNSAGADRYLAKPGAP